MLSFGSVFQLNDLHVYRILFNNNNKKRQFGFVDLLGIDGLN